MITDAVWIDIDEDGRQDLVTTGIWLPIQFYRNDGDQLHDITDSIGFSVPQGWWYSLAKGDFNNYGNLDLLLADNIYNTHPEIPRMDAGNGLWLRGNGSGEFKPISPFKSGFLAPQNARELGLIQTPDGCMVIVANNNELLQMYSIRE